MGELEKQKEAGMSEDDLKALEAQMRINAANAQVVSLKQKFAELERYRVPPKQEAMDVLEGVLYLLKYQKVASVKSKLEGKELESLNKLSVVYGALWSWGTAAITAKEVEIAAREAAEAASS